MAWERNFEAKVLKVREKELKYQKLNYTVEVRREVTSAGYSLIHKLRRHYGMLSGTVDSGIVMNVC